MGKRNAELEDEEAFPRGKEVTQQEELPEDKTEKADAGKDAAPAQKKRKKAAAKGKKGADEDDVDVAENPIQAMRFVSRFKPGHLVEGTLTMAAVREVTDEEILLGLPYCMVGYVPAAQATEVAAESKPRLTELYKPGQLVVAVVVALTDVTGRANRQRIELSLRPSLANAGLTAETLQQGMWLPASVENEEEHVLRLSFGVAGLHGLLKKSELAESGVATKPGSIIQVAVASANARSGTVRCTTKPADALGSDPLRVESLKAGFLVTACVDKVMRKFVEKGGGDQEELPNQGLALTFCGNHTGLIHVHHQYDATAEEDAPYFKRKKRVTARVLAVIPDSTRTIVHLTLLPHLVDWQPKTADLESLAVGDRLSGSLVDNNKHYGMRLLCSPKNAEKSDAKVLAFCPMPRLPDNEEEPAADGLECRVLHHNYLENTLMVTRRKYDLHEDTLVSVSELSDGQLVTGSITRIEDYGVIVRLSEYVTGMIPLRHLTDVPLPKVPKKLQVEGKVKCRVLWTNPEKRQLTLTKKKSLVDSDFQLSSFEQARKSMIVTGSVTSIKEHGAIVSFFGTIHGLIPSEELDIDEAPAPGMVVTVRITGAQKKTRRLRLSLDLEGGKAPSEFGELSALKPRREKMPSVGEVYTTLRAVQCTKDGVVVRFVQNTGDGEGKQRLALVPVGHISDDAAEGAEKYKELKEKLGGIVKVANMGDFEAKGVKLSGSGIVLARYFAAEEKNPKGIAVMSRKASMLAAAEEGKFVSELGAIEESGVYDGYVQKLLDCGALVSVGSWKLAGLALQGQLDDYSKKHLDGKEVELGQSVKVRITKVDREKERFRVDMRITDDRNAVVHAKEVGAPVAMWVQTVRETSFDVRAQKFVGHVHATQTVDVEDLEFGKAVTPLEDVEKKTTVEARIVRILRETPAAGDATKKKKNDKIHFDHLSLTRRPSMMKEGVSKEDIGKAIVSLDDLKPGSVVPAAVVDVKKGLVWFELNSSLRARCLALDATEDLNVAQSLADHFHPGQVYKAVVLRVSKKEKHVEISLLEPGKVLEEGTKTLARLESIDVKTAYGCAGLFSLRGNVKGWVHVSELYDHWAQMPVGRLKLRQFYDVYVMDKARKWDRVEVSIRPSKVYGQKESADEKRITDFEDIQVGQKVSGYVVSANAKGVFVALSSKVEGQIKLSQLSEAKTYPDVVAKLYPSGTLLKNLTVIGVDLENNKMEMSLRSGDGLKVEQLSVGDVVSGRVRGVAAFGIFMRLEGSNLDGLIHKSEISDSASISLESFNRGDLIRRAKVVKIDGSKVSFSIKPSHFDDVEDDEDSDQDEDKDGDDLLDGKADGSDSDDDLAEIVKEVAAEKAAKRKTPAAEAEASKPKSAEESKVAEDVAEDASEAEEKPKKRKKATEDVKTTEDVEEKEKPAKKALIAVAAADASDDDAAPWEKAAAGKGAAKIGNEAAVMFADFTAALVDSDDDDASDQDTVGEAKADGATRRDKKKKKHEESKELQKREAEAAQSRWTNDPQSVEDFERLLLTEGDTSIVWIRYMAFHLKTSDLERARQVAERAVKHVGFSEAQERFNVWVAYLNLECTFGADDTRDAVIKRASAHNDAREVYLQLARIHERNKKPELATKAYDFVCKKFSQSKRVWQEFMSFLYREWDFDGARKTLPRALSALPRQKHPLVVTKAAILEYKMGSVDRGRSLFEGLVDTFPKRTDLWSVYIDAHIGAHTPPKVSEPDLQEVRGLLERCCSMSMKAAKMRFFFKRWLDFEKKWGDAESQDKVKLKAAAFVESHAA